MRYFIFLLCLIISQIAVAAKHFVIDTDMGSDDVIGILYLLQRQDIKIDAISIIGNGEVPCTSASRNMRGILQMMHQPNIPFACGGEELLTGQHRFPEFLIREQAALSGTNLLLPKTKTRPSSLSAVDFLIATLNQSKEPVTLLTLGPLTNVAQAFQKDPQIKNHIKDIFIMGGAVFVPGNITGLLPKSENKAAEWNIYIDPAAADIVFKQPVPITMVSLDITNQVPLKLTFYKKLEKNRQTSAARYTYALLMGDLHWIIENNFYFWDPLAAVIASDTSIAKFSYQPLKVIVAPGAESGRTAFDKTAGRKIRIVTSIDKKRFETLLLNELNHT